MDELSELFNIETNEFTNKAKVCQMILSLRIILYLTKDSAYLNCLFSLKRKYKNGVLEPIYLNLSEQYSYWKKDMKFKNNQ
jgi:hypothetical protein